MRLSSLPRFKSLLVHGPYNPFAPIHLSLSVPPPHHTIFFTPSRHSLLQALQTHDDADEWLNSHSGTGTVAGMSSRVTVFYPNSPQHLVAVLAMLRTHDVSSPSVPVVPNVTLDRAPTLLVLHEPSAYFLPGQEEGYTHRRSSSPASLVVFDSRLDRLKFPVLRTSPRSTSDVHDDPEDVPRPESVLLFAEKYFELSGTFQCQLDPCMRPITY
ncbi:hypothetical protein HD554DRAFT_2011221 [Boletus coccyginus]|nr:hypothetical protein HD554DRAFT_2011221 [Boletus coccyginus]